MFIMEEGESMAPRAVNFKTNSIIYFEGDRSDKIYILKSGKVSLNYKDIETGKDMHDMIKTGEFFGVKSALGHYNRDETAVVVHDSVVLALTVYEFENMMLRNLRVTMKMLKVFSNQLRRIHRKVQNLLSTDGNVDPETGLFLVGQYYLKNGKGKQALYTFQRYLTYYPKGRHAMEATENLRKAERLAGNAGAAKAAARRSDPGNISAPDSGESSQDSAKVYYNAVSLYSKGDFEEAFKGFQRIVKDGSDKEHLAQAEYEMGRCLYQLKKYSECIKQFTSLVQRYPKHPELNDALYYIGVSYKASGNTEKAKSFLTKLLDRAEADSQVRLRAEKALEEL